MFTYSLGSVLLEGTRESSSTSIDSVGTCSSVLVETVELVLCLKQKKFTEKVESIL